MSHLGVKLQAVEGQIAVFYRGHRAGDGRGQRHEIGADLRNLVAVAHPHLDLRRDAVEQAAGRGDAAVGPAVLAGRRLSTRPPSTSHINCMP